MKRRSGKSFRRNSISSAKKLVLKIHKSIRRRSKKLRNIDNGPDLIVKGKLCLLDEQQIKEFEQIFVDNENHVFVKMNIFADGRIQEFENCIVSQPVPGSEYYTFPEQSGVLFGFLPREISEYKLQ